MKKAEKIGRAIIEAFGILATLVLIAMMLVTVCDVFLRSFFNRPIIGSMEISCMMMVCVVFFGIAWCALKGEHIRVDVISAKLSRRGRIVLDSIDNILTMIFAALIAIQCFSQALFAKQMGLKTLMLEIPRYPFMFVTSFGFVLLFCAMIIMQYNVKKDVDANPAVPGDSEQPND